MTLVNSNGHDASAENNLFRMYKNKNALYLICWDTLIWFCKHLLGNVTDF